MRPGPVAAAGLVVLLGGAPARAQISPGPLSRLHADLEGSAGCLRCHDSSRGVAAEKCLSCHKALQQRLAVGRGLHARTDYRDCKLCHVEHQGRDVDLVWWGKQGRAGFDHALTGHALGGKHAQLACERCHKPPVYIGLATACAACHRDEHRGQFAGRACADCHGLVAWKPAAGFDHARSRWPLTGRHGALGCEKCHNQRQPDAALPGQSFVAFRAVSGSECVGCHQDVHGGRLGASCSNCHTTTSWRGPAPTGFDHRRTRYPLQGRHATVACDRCHLPGRPMRLAHERCTDCHRDPHAGAPARTAEAGRCERCHDVNGFRPARFGVEEHARTAYPLTGAHLAVACDACHKPAARSGVAMPLRLAARRCAECHRDPHRGELVRLVERSGCEACHRVESWKLVAFDHGSTSYPLEGRHTTVTCNGCHLRPQGAGAAVLRFAGLESACESCHRDPHAGQFAGAAGGTACKRCHTTAAMKPLQFDHRRDSRYPLDGAHAKLACSACHRPASQAGQTFVRYKPLPTTCSGCHGPAGRPAKGEKP